MTIIGVPADAYGFGSAYMVSIAPIMVLATVFVQYAILPVFYNNNIDNCYTVSIVCVYKCIKLKCIIFSSISSCGLTKK